MEKRINVVVKEPGKPAERRTIDNTLKALQQLVGGYIETVTFASDVLAIVNEEGRLLGLPESGVMGLVGTVVFVRPKKENFASLKEIDAGILLDFLGE